MTKIEAGDRRVSALELARVAEALDVRIEWFVDESPNSLLSHRNAQEPGTPSPLIDRAAERVTHAVEFVAGLDAQLASALPELGTESLAPTSVGVERLAARAREVLGAPLDGPLIDLAELTATVGLLAFSLDLGVESADAAMIMLNRGGVAIVNGALRVGRRRLALAHEFGHYLVADDYAVDWRVSEYHDAERREARLDQFARALLLPQESVREDWAIRLAASEGDVRTAAVLIASAYRVDMATLARRLEELDSVEPGEAAAVRSTRTRRADIVELNLVVADELAAPTLPRAYERAVLRLYRDETVSAARALDLLLDAWDEEMLPTLPERAVGETWRYV